MQEQKWNQDGWAFLTWADSSGWEEVKHMGWGNLGSWVICRAPFGCWAVFWAAFWNGQGAVNWGTNCGLSLMSAWPFHILLLSPPEEGELDHSWTGRELKNSHLHLNKPAFCSWAAAEGGFEDQGGTLTAPGLYLFSEFVVLLLLSKKYKS